MVQALRSFNVLFCNMLSMANVGLFCNGAGDRIRELNGS